MEKKYVSYKELFTDLYEQFGDKLNQEVIMLIAKEEVPFTHQLKTSCKDGFLAALGSKELWLVVFGGIVIVIGIPFVLGSKPIRDIFVFWQTKDPSVLSDEYKKDTKSPTPEIKVNINNNINDNKNIKLKTP